MVPNITCAPLTKLLPLTWIVNAPTPIVCGLTDETTGIGFSRVIELVPCTVGVLTSAACTDTTLLEGTLAGAVYWPAELIVPGVALPPAIPFTDQVTAVFDVPIIVAVNCRTGSPGRTLDAAGLTDTLGCAEEDAPPEPAQPVAREMMTKQSVQFNRRVDK